MMLPRLMIGACASVLLLAVPGAVAAQETKIPLARLISHVAQQTGKTFIVDPRVVGEVTLVGQDLANIDYDEFLDLLKVRAYAVVENGRTTHVIPEEIVRIWPVPIAEASQTYPDALHVTKIIPVRNAPAVTFVPLLRPLLNQGAHFVAFACTNDLLVSDRFANVRRVESLVRALDRGEPYQPGKCLTSPDTPRQNRTEPPAAERPEAGKPGEK